MEKIQSQPEALDECQVEDGSDGSQWSVSPAWSKLSKPTMGTPHSTLAALLQELPLHLRDETACLILDGACPMDASKEPNTGSYRCMSLPMGFWAV